MTRAAVLLVVVLAGCKGDKPREQPPAPVPSGSAPPASAPAIDAPAAEATPALCELGLAAVAGATCEKPEMRASLMAMKRSLDGLVDTIGKASGDPVQFQVMCAQLVIAIERDAKRAGCTLAIDDLQRGELMAVLDAWYAHRTRVTPTGHAAADAVIAKIAAVRDATCECRDGACLDRVDKQLVAIGEMPPDAPQAARDLGSKLLEDAARCANRVRTITDPPK